RDQDSKSNRTSPWSSFKRASNALPDFDLKPFSTWLLPRRRSAWAVRALIRLPAIVFQMANLHPLRQPLQPKDFSCSITSEPQSGQGPSAPVGFAEAFSPAGELPSPFAAFAIRWDPGFVRLFAGFRLALLCGCCGRPLGTGISVSAPEFVRLRT